MPTTPALTSESEALLAQFRSPAARNRKDYPVHWLDREDLERIEAAAVARHVRDTGCEGLREALEESHRQWGSYGTHPGEAYRTLERAVRAHLAALAPAASANEVPTSANVAVASSATSEEGGE